MGRDVYCLLRGRPAALALDDDASPHIEIKVETEDGWHRVAVNARSGDPPHDLLYCAIEPFKHRMTRLLPLMPEGRTPLRGRLRALGLDYTRDGFVNRARMRVVPYRLAGPENDLRELLGKALGRAVRAKDATLYAFGEGWGPERGRPDLYFGFEPGQGLHDVHMNQGSKGRHRGKNRARQDGGLLIHFADEDRWIGIFLAFQTQSWRTDPRNGRALR